MVQIEIISICKITVPWKNICRALKRQRLKITPQRRAVIAFLLKRKTHASPYDVYAGVKKNIPRLGLPTIYRILEEMKGIGLLAQVLFS